MRILFVNWKDLAHPSAGGAEVFTEQIARGLTRLGNEVTIFASRFLGSQPESLNLGVRIIRSGGKFTVYAKAREFVRRHASNYDVIIDEINTVPFGIPSLVKNRPVIALIHQLAREVWFHETPFPVARLGYHVLEPFWLRRYRHVPTITVSDSTRGDLVALGFDTVSVVQNGIGMKPLETVGKKEPSPVLAFMARLVKSKLPDHAILAFKKVRKVFSEAELWILGDGYLKPKLQREAGSGITFFGKVPEDKKVKLLSAASLLMVPSVREGWGISVIEANACGTPAVGYSIPGLRDSIVNGVTGLLVPPRPEALANAVSDILGNPRRSQEMSVNALEWSRRFSWNNSAADFHESLQAITAKYRQMYLARTEFAKNGPQ